MDFCLPFADCTIRYEVNRERKIILKKIFKTAIVLTVAACIVFSCSLVSMADEVYGTYEDGITAGLYQSNTHQVPHVEGFKNADFKEGLKYWTTTPPKSKASDFVDLLKEGDKNYVSLTPADQWDGIVSVRFTDKRLEVGMKPVVIYEWRSANPEAFQVYLVQAQSNAEGKSSSGNEIRLSNGASASIPISAAKTAEEWNVSMSLSVKDIQKPSKGDDTIYLFAGVQAYKSKTVKADIANLRIGTYNRAEGKVYDLDGTVMYDLKAMNAKEAENFYKYEDPFSFPKMEKKFAAGGKSVTVEEGKGDTLWIIIGVAGGAVIIAAVVIVIIVAKKKKAAPADDTASDDATDENSDTAEETEENKEEETNE